MAFSSVFVILLLWSTFQFGLHLGLLNNIDSDFKFREALQMYLNYEQGENMNRQTRSLNLPPISAKHLQKWITFGEEIANRMARLEENLVGSNIVIQPNTPERGQLINNFPNNEAVGLGRNALIVSKATAMLSHEQCVRYGFNKFECAEFIKEHKLTSTTFSANCPDKDVDCSEYYKYRSSDGSCNHLTHPLWGKSLSSYRRILQPKYSDGIQFPRESLRGGPLPNARKISIDMINDVNKYDTLRSQAFVFWGLFIEHDLTNTPVMTMLNTPNFITCCTAAGRKLAPRYIHPLCDPIMLPSNDPVYSDLNVQCMNYVRSMPVIRDECNFGPIEQMNEVTHYLDGSMIYGSNKLKADKLRHLEYGKLLNYCSKDDEQLYLPLFGTGELHHDKPYEKFCLSPKSQTCYLSGDYRVNYHPYLVTLHTVWLKEHFRIASILQELNPHWKDEQLYQETRRIVIAEIQHITYNEWLPLVLGSRYSSIYTSSKAKFSQAYDENLKPSVSNSFATAAIRFLQSMLDGKIKFEDTNGQVNESLMSDYYFSPEDISHGQYYSLLRGMSRNPAGLRDLFYTEEITSKLFKDSSDYGLDLFALDIQRGRDHGLPGYNDFRVFCNKTRARNFDDFSDVIPSTVLAKLKQLYSHPDDIDLLVGGMAESSEEDSIVGFTFRCILSEQFSQIKKTDRFFYDVQNQPNSFSKKQLSEIKKVTLGKLFCHHTKTFEVMQPNIFKIPDGRNKLTDCDELFPINNLTPWKELK